MKQVNLPLEVAKKMWVSANECIRDFALANYTKEELEAKELPKTFKDLEIKLGYEVTRDALIDKVESTHAMPSKILFATKEQAEASIALAQLSQLMQVYNDGWIPDWTKSDIKCCIEIYKNEIITTSYTVTCRFLAFKTKELRSEFLNNFKDLIEQAKPLL